MFEVGDRVRIVRASSMWSHLIGEECTLTGVDEIMTERTGKTCWVTDIRAASTGGFYGGDATCFKKIDDGDKDTKISWEDMKDIWTPEGVEV